MTGITPPIPNRLSYLKKGLLILPGNWLLRADVSKYQPEVYKNEKSKILKKIHKVALGKLLT